MMSFSESKSVLSVLLLKAIQFPLLKIPMILILMTILMQRMLLLSWLTFSIRSLNFWEYEEQVLSSR